MKKQVLTLRCRVADEAGAALVVVLALSITMLILITAALSFTISGVKVAQTDADTTAALAAAYAGVDEYSSRLSNDSLYQRYGNPASAFTIATGSMNSVSLPTGTLANPAFGTGPTGTWAQIAGTGNPASFRYEVDNSQYSSTGILRVRSTGRVGKATQSVVADLKQSGFIDFLYFSNYEIMDPKIADTRCTEDGWSATKSGNTVSHGYYCTEIQFGSNDVLDGKVHSNDMLLVCGAEFKKKVTSSSPITSPEYSKACTGGGTFRDDANKNGVIPRVPTMVIPPTNDDMPNEARTDLPAQVPRPGCLYTGPTTIKFLSNGKVNVVSPWTKVTRPSLTDPSLSRNDPECGALADLNSSAGATFTPPAQNLLFVQNVQGIVGNPNYWKPGISPVGFTCNNGGTIKEGWVYKQGTGTPPTVRYPLANESQPKESKSNAPSYGCTNGDAYISGTVNGQITVATGNFVYVTGDLLYNDVALDVLGIVALNAVWVWNPMAASDAGYGCSSGSCPINPKDRTIDGAILSVGHTFQVQNYAVGPYRGKLTVYGAIAQNFRGTVGTGSGSTGYGKNYGYDKRLFSVSPPKFLKPTSTTYGVTKYALVKTAFLANGDPAN